MRIGLWLHGYRVLQGITGLLVTAASQMDKRFCGSPKTLLRVCETRPKQLRKFPTVAAWDDRSNARAKKGRDVRDLGGGAVVEAAVLLFYSHSSHLVELVVDGCRML